MLTEVDNKFLNKRKRLSALWNAVATTMLAMLVATYFWMFFKVPYIANPKYVIDALSQGNMDRSIMTVSAGLLPVVVICLFVAVAVIILFGFTIFSNEKRYLAIIENILSEQNASKERNL